MYRINADGSDRVKALPDPILEFEDVSPDGRWAMVARTLGQSATLMAGSLDGGDSVTLCPGYCLAQWTSDGGTLSVVVARPMGGEDTLIVPVSRDHSLPALPSGGIQTRAEMAKSENFRRFRDSGAKCGRICRIAARGSPQSLQHPCAMKAVCWRQSHLGFKTEFTVVSNLRL